MLNEVDVMQNGVNREIPVQIDGIGALKPFYRKMVNGQLKNIERLKERQLNPNKNKIIDSLEGAIEATDLKDGTILAIPVCDSSCGVC